MGKYIKSLVVSYTISILFLYVGIFSVLILFDHYRYLPIFTNTNWSLIPAYNLFLFTAFIYPLTLTKIFSMMLSKSNKQFILNKPLFLLLTIMFELSYWTGFYLTVYLNTMITHHDSVRFLSCCKPPFIIESVNIGLPLTYFTILFVHALAITPMFLVIPNLHRYFQKSVKNRSGR